MAYKDNGILEKELNHISHSISHLTEVANALSASEYAMHLFGLMLSAKRTVTLSSKYKFLLEDHVFVGKVLDLETAYSSIDSATTKLEIYLEKSIETPKLDYNKDKADNQLNHENTLYNFGIIENKTPHSFDGLSDVPSTDTTTVRREVILSMRKAVDSIYECLKEIKDNLMGMIEKRKECFGSKEHLVHYLRSKEKEYLESENWEEDKKSFVIDMRDRLGYMEDDTPYKQKNSYEYHYKMITSSADALTKAEKEGEEDGRGRYCIENRDILTEEQLYEHLRNRNCLRLLRLRIASFDWCETPFGDEAKLFPNIAARDLVKSLAPVIADKIEMKGYYYAVMKLAFDDFALTLPPERKNAGEWLSFVNIYVRKPRKEDPIKDNGTITKVTGKLLGKRFRELSKDNLGGTNMEDVFDSYAKVYHTCVHIINFLMAKDLLNEGFAECWCEPCSMRLDVDEFGDWEKLKMQADFLREGNLNF